MYKRSAGVAACETARYRAHQLVDPVLVCLGFDLATKTGLTSVVRLHGDLLLQFSAAWTAEKTSVPA